jgi:hypothetical protein
MEDPCHLSGPKTSQLLPYALKSHFMNTVQKSACMQHPTRSELHLLCTKQVPPRSPDTVSPCDAEYQEKMITMSVCADLKAYPFSKQKHDKIAEEAHASVAWAVGAYACSDCEDAT